MLQDPLSRIVADCAACRCGYTELTVGATKATSLLPHPAGLRHPACTRSSWRMKAPVVLFAYNRPDHLRIVLDALIANHGFDETILFVCCDGPKTSADEEGVERTRRFLRTRSRGNINIIESDINRGSARSIRDGVGRFVTDFGRVIVMEDDLITSRYFLDYMNTALDLYADSDRVLQICGFGVRLQAISAQDPFFVPLGSSWGWATWKRAWDGFNETDFAGAFKELQASSRLRHEFDLNGRYPMYFALRRSVLKQTETWDVRWQLYLFLTKGLALWPARSLVTNIGTDGSGVHSGWSRRNASTVVTDLADEPVLSFPSSIDVNPNIWEAVQASLAAGNPRWHHWLTWWARHFS